MQAGTASLRLACACPIAQGPSGLALQGRGKVLGEPGVELVRIQQV